MNSAPDPDVLVEAQRIVGGAAAEDLPLCLLGGVAVALVCPSAGAPPLRRRYADIDLAGRSSERGRIAQLLSGMGYLADETFNMLHGHRRLYFWDEANGRQLDVFLDGFEMCHSLELRERVTAGSATLPLADLLLMKLQVMETNEKDLIDIIALLLDHPLTQDASGIDLRYITALTGDDWGLWKTTSTVAERAAQFAGGLSGVDSARVQEQVKQYLGALDACPKSRGWRMRARVGERKRWYTLPEEVA